jgi:hypothetical protein
MFTVQTEAFTSSSDCTTCTPSVGYNPPPYPPGTYYPTNGHPFDEGGNLSARWRTGDTRLALSGRGDFGDEGDRVGADASGEHVFETRYVLSGRAGVWQWDDKLRPDRSTTGVQAVALLGYRFMPRSQGSIEGEYDYNAIAGLRFRLMLMLTLGLSK